MADQVGNPDLPGVKLIVDRMSDGTSIMSPSEFGDDCLDLLGPIEVSEKTNGSLIEHAGGGGEIRRVTEAERSDFARRVMEML